MKRVMGITVVLAAALIGVSGCGTRVRTYILEKERVDQDLSEGNVGYLAGAADPAERSRERKLTRQTYVAEVELPVRSPREKRLIEEVSIEPGQELIREPEPEPGPGKPAAAASTPQPSRGPAVTTYTVRNNDTLSKVSMEVYGTPTRWKEIYEANADRIKGPDRIYAGQVLKIPQNKE